MAHAIALVRKSAINPVERLRSLLVCGCALALICAGQALPFF